jgi:hypothetical protein
MANQLTDTLASFEADHVWAAENRETLVQQYPDQWVAVKDHRVIAFDPDLGALLAKLADPSQTCVEFVTREPMEMVL